ncbi:MAG: translation elongation factor Ts [Acidobacteriota bacterium]
MNAGDQANISAGLVKELREKTGAGVMDCKVALSEAKGNVDEAVKILRKKGLAAAFKKSGRTTSEGIIGSYIHPGGKIGVLLEVSCETDFVARTADFQQLVKDLAMQIAASSPRFVGREQVTEEVLIAEREIYRSQAAASGKPEKVLEKIVDGKMEKFYAEACLLEQPFVKNMDVTVKDHIASLISKIGENIQVKRFVRFALGEGNS